MTEIMPIAEPIHIGANKIALFRTKLPLSITSSMTRMNDANQQRIQAERATQKSYIVYIGFD